MNPPADNAYAARIAALHRELGLPADYAARRGLPLQPEADEATLITVGQKPDGTPVRLIPPAAAAWQQMYTTASAAGRELLPISGFRSVARQAAIIREKLAAGHSIPDILSILAAPGFSEHHTGRALDIGSLSDPPLLDSFTRTYEYGWLISHAATYGFHLSYPRNNRHGIVFEPWHWCWRP